MRIVHLCLSAFYIEGFGYQENTIPKYNKKDGHEVTIIASKFTFNEHNGQAGNADVGDYINKDGIKVIRIDYKYPLPEMINRKIKIFDKTYETIAKEFPDLIFSHGIQFLDLNEVVRYIKDHPECRLIADTHAAFINSGLNCFSRVFLHKTLYKTVIKKALNYISRLFVIAPGCRDFAKKMYDIPDSKMENLFLGADMDMINHRDKNEISTKIRKELNINADDFVLITGGKLSKGKNTKLLVEAVKKICNNNIKLIIFGVFSDDCRDEMINIISRDNRIKYIGWIESSKVYDYFLSSDIAVFPGTKSALWEQAICSGLPLICRRWTGMEHVDVGGNVIFFDDDKADHIKDIIIEVSENADLYEQMRQVAMDSGVEIFSYELISRKAIETNLIE